MTLADRQTRIAQRFAADTFADVLAIFGLQRISKICPKIVSTAPFRRANKERGNYYVYTNNNTLVKQRILEDLAEELGVDLTVETN